jgi:uncharacterized protein (TIGR03435 family)
MAGLIAGMLGGAMALPVLHAQSVGFTPRADAAQIPSYELVTIHPRPEGKEGVAIGIHNDPDGWRAGDVTLKDLIGEAFGFQIGPLSDQQLEGAPAWAKTQRFDVVAKADESDVEKLKAIDKEDTMMSMVRELATRTPPPRMLMLQRLLEDRFRLKVHYEQKVMPIYEMTVAKGGLKMKTPHPKDPENGSMQMNSGKLTGDNVPMSFIPAILALDVERPVEDKTGVGGNYDFELHWSRMDDKAADNGAGDAGPAIFTALEEQMGLKLQPGKGPVWVIVVDHAEMPSEN